jgi:hypothetical protein
MQCEMLTESDIALKIKYTKITPSNRTPDYEAGNRYTL